MKTVHKHRQRTLAGLCALKDERVHAERIQRALYGPRKRGHREERPANVDAVLDVIRTYGRSRP